MRKFNISLLLLSILCNNLYSQSIIANRNIRNCIVFANAYGYAKYYYPTKKTTQLQWEKIVSTGVTTVFECNNDDELIDSLQSFFSCVAPGILFTKNDTIIKDTINVKKKKYYYEHEGFGDGKLRASSKLTTFLIKLTQPYKTTIKYEKPITNKKYYYTTYDNITFHVPYGLDKKYKIKSSENKNNESKLYQNIGAVIIAWNVYKHFYPYQENIDSDWYKILETSIKMLSTDTNNYKIYEALNYLTNTLNDGHARVFYKGDTLHYQPPFSVKVIDSNLVVDKVHLEFRGELSPGTQLLKINDVESHKLIKSMREQVSSSTIQWSNLRVEQEILKGSKNSTFSILYTDNGQLKEKTIVRNKMNNNWIYFTGNPIKLLDDSIYYLNVETLTYDSFKKNIAKFNDSKGIIIDFRGYPKSVNILKHFKDTLLNSPYWKVPYKTLFSIDKDLYTSRGSALRWTITPSKKIITVPVVFLTDANAISFSETCLDMIKYYKLGKIIGQPTAGSNGNVNGFWIYDKYNFIFTGMKVLNNDGELITKNGIIPDILVPVTEDGLKNSKDEILLYGIEYIKKQEALKYK
ncbi:MAG: hypothetical protein KFKLKKLM_00711 [Flavobacteriales bacterium]|nr:hypothetical protein [Flavobacteriales bacterium]